MRQSQTCKSSFKSYYIIIGQLITRTIPYNLTHLIFFPIKSLFNPLDNEVRPLTDKQISQNGFILYVLHQKSSKLCSLSFKRRDDDQEYLNLMRQHQEQRCCFLANE
ncbi:hypothetical protein pb186bvf_010463 [Paramecium bursaria]